MLQDEDFYEIPPTNDIENNVHVSRAGIDSLCETVDELQAAKLIHQSRRMGIEDILDYQDETIIDGNYTDDDIVEQVKSDMINGKDGTDQADEPDEIVEIPKAQSFAAILEAAQVLLREADHMRLSHSDQLIRILPRIISEARKSQFQAQSARQASLTSFFKPL